MKILKTIFVLFVFQCMIEGCSCSDTNDECYNHSKLIGKVHYLSNPVHSINKFKELKELVNSNKEYFSKNSRFIQNLEDVGNDLQQKSITNIYNYKKDEPIIVNSISKMAVPPQQKKEVLERFNSYNVKPLFIGNDLIWLAGVLPLCAQGNWEKFMNNDGHQERKQQIIVAEIMYRTMNNSESVEFEDFLIKAAPLAEYETTILANMVMCD